MKEGGQTGKLIFAVVALGVAGYMGFSFLSHTPKSDEVKAWVICLKCENAELFSVRQRKDLAKKGQTVSCSKCSSPETESGFECAACGKVVPSENHGKLPAKCKGCKKPFVPKEVPQ